MSVETTVIQELLTLAGQKVAENQREAIQTWLDNYCKDLPATYIEEASAELLLPFLMDRFSFLTEDLGNEVKVAAHTDLPALPGLDGSAIAFETRLPDCKDIVRTIKAHVRTLDLSTQFIVHPVVGMQTDGSGTVTGIDPTGQAGDRYSHVFIVVTQLDQAKAEEVRSNLVFRLRALLHVSRDYPAIQQMIPPVREMLTGNAASSQSFATEADDALKFLDWLDSGNFYSYGYAFLPIGAAVDGPVAGLQNGLGLLRMDELADLKKSVADLAQVRLARGEYFIFYRIDDVSPIRSETALRYFGVKQADPNTGEVTGEHLFIGLYSSQGAIVPNNRIPAISKKIDQVMARVDKIPGTHSFRRMYAVLDSMPGEDIFYSTQDELQELTEAIRRVESADQPKTFVRRRPTGTRVSVTCVVPRERYSDALKSRIEEEIKRFLGVSTIREYVRASDDEAPLRIHFYRRYYRDGISDADLDGLERRIDKLLETWHDRLKRLVYNTYRDRPGEKTAHASPAEIWQRYGSAFPESYWTSQPPGAALADIAAMEQIAQGGTQVTIGRIVHGGEEYIALRTVSSNKLVLNDTVPVLDAMALSTTGRLAEVFTPAGRPPMHLTVFSIMGRDEDLPDDPKIYTRLTDIAARVLNGLTPLDPLLGLGYLAGLNWREIDLLITYRNYFVQVFRQHSARSVNETLLKHASLSQALIAYFIQKFSPDLDESPEQRQAGILAEQEGAYLDKLNDVSVIHEDLILRQFLSLIKATVRTNFYKPSSGERVSIKIHSASVSGMPMPCPLYEIYVHGPAVEGIHLRGGMVARGGLRHSDRPDDFRTEVQGLQRTQMTKNAVIVPVGSKGGFVTRRYFTDRERQEAESRAQYQQFISGLLDITDNLDGDTVVPPGGVVRYDSDDPYLVVAADKGTATFSDLANEISEKYGFWLGDAFASGGSQGYDHKKMGITAKGAWVNVERHFRELGINIREESITVAGIGDMAGDVFGNGMLLNNKMKVVAAFNHKHIFVDPNPDPAASYAERKRLFELPRSNWTDYDSSLISDGGGIYDRSAKSIRLSSQAQQMLGLPNEPVSGPTLIKAILKLNVDLMWLGGIGTYFKASTESQADAGDPVNDLVRVNASEMRCRVLGEGANLGITVRARMEFLRNGGHCNTDFIDNSAGVDCSDHEVNLKIMVGRLMERGTVHSVNDRNALLRSLEDEVGEACLRNNYLQSALVTMEQMRADKTGIESMLTILGQLQRKKILDRAAEFVPNDDVLREGFVAGHGLPRTSICSLVSNTKNDLYQQVLASEIPDKPFFHSALEGYFPQRLVSQYRDHLDAHPLKREIVATVVTNDLVNQAGSTFLNELMNESATPIDLLVMRYFKADELLGGKEFRAEVHGLDNKVGAFDQYEALLTLEDTLRALVRWWNWNEDHWKLRTEEVEAIKPQFLEATQCLVSGLTEMRREEVEAQEAALLEKGFPQELAHRIATLPTLRHAFLVLAISRETGRSCSEIAKSIFPIGEAMHLDAVDAILHSNSAGNAYENRFQSILERESANLRLTLTRKVFSMNVTDGGTPLDAFTEQYAAGIDQIGEGVQTVKKTSRGSQVPLFILFDDYKTLLR